MRFHELQELVFKQHTPKFSEQPSLEKFDKLNALSAITQPDDYELPEELKHNLIKFIDTCIDYKVENHSTHFINQLLQSNDSNNERSITLTSITGIKSHVINSLIRQQLICKMNELASEHDRTGDSFDKKLQLG
jgi:hypothetical protein